MKFARPEGGGIEKRKKEVQGMRRDRREQVSTADYKVKQTDIERTRKEKRAEAIARKKAEMEASRQLPKLHVTLTKATNLPKMDLFGSCDAYVKIYVGAESWKSRTVKNSYNPVWNQVTTFDVPPLVDVLEVELFDWDLISADDFVGGCEVPLRLALDDDPNAAHTFELINPKREQQAWKAVTGQRKSGNGQITLQLRWADNERPDDADGGAAPSKPRAPKKAASNVIGKGSAGADRALVRSHSQSRARRGERGSARGCARRGTKPPAL